MSSYHMSNFKGSSLRLSEQEVYASAAPKVVGCLQESEFGSQRGSVVVNGSGDSGGSVAVGGERFHAGGKIGRQGR